MGSVSDRGPTAGDEHARRQRLTIAVRRDLQRFRRSLRPDLDDRAGLPRRGVERFERLRHGVGEHRGFRCLRSLIWRDPVDKKDFTQILLAPARATRPVPACCLCQR